MPTYALNFYSPVVADQLRTGRKTATIRLGDKSAQVPEGHDRRRCSSGARYGPREKVFDAVIDKVEVKPLAELSPREIEHDNPEIRRAEEMATSSASSTTARSRRRTPSRDPLLADRRHDVLRAGETMVPPPSPLLQPPAHGMPVPGLPAGQAGLRPPAPESRAAEP